MRFLVSSLIVTVSFVKVFVGLTAQRKSCTGAPGGMFYRKSDSEKLKDLMNGFSKELEEAYKDDKFLYDAFLYELGNHEYCITLDLTDTLDALGLTLEEVQSDSRIITILRQAEQEYLKGVE